MTNEEKLAKLEADVALRGYPKEYAQPGWVTKVAWRLGLKKVRPTMFWHPFQIMFFGAALGTFLRMPIHVLSLRELAFESPSLLYVLVCATMSLMVGMAAQYKTKKTGLTWG